MLSPPFFMNKAYEITLLYVHLCIVPPNFIVFCAIRVISKEIRRLALLRATAL
jgi:hypothetical protein